MSQDNVSSFLQEVFRMKGFSHENVLTMTGLVLKKNVPFVVLPFMANGDLKSYLQSTDRVSMILILTFSFFKDID